MPHHFIQAGDFSPQASVYARSRPTYPPRLVDQLLKHAHIRDRDPVADIGAGTGILTAMLFKRGLNITAVEPSKAMQGYSPDLPGVKWRTGTFESTGLDDASQVWIVAAQAFHWANPEAALPELRRVLRPDGHLSILWNTRDNQANPVVAWTHHAISRHVPDFTHTYRDRNWTSVLTSTGDFTDIVQSEARHTIRMSRTRYCDLWRSHNRLNTIAGPKRFATFMEDLEHYLTQVRIKTIEVPYNCKALTVLRRD